MRGPGPNGVRGYTSDGYFYAVISRRMCPRGICGYHWTALSGSSYRQIALVMYHTQTSHQMSHRNVTSSVQTDS